MFASLSLVRRIESAESRSVASVATAAKQHGHDVVLARLGDGVAAYVAPGSPFNKVAGLGFSAWDESALARVEEELSARDSPIQVELSSFADPALVNLLVRRQYAFAGYEHVLGRSLLGYAAEPSPQGIEVERSAHAAPSEEWCEVLMSGFLQPDQVDGPPPAQNFAREQVTRAYLDMAADPSIERWLARREGRVAGGAALRIDGSIAQLCGAATRPSQRRAGVQTALLGARLRDAQARGADLAVVTTQPGSKSQQNVQRLGFALLYARALWVRAAG